jgi:hypothetical protein
MTMYTTVLDGITFVERCPRFAKVIKPIRVEIGGILTSAQSKNLDDLKRLMAQQVRAAGGNAVIDFKYGQRSVGFWASKFDRDDVQWYGEGKIAVS